MLPIVLQLDPASARHHRAFLTPQALADVLADALPQALAQFDESVSPVAMVACGDLTGLQAYQVLTLQIATLDRFLGAHEAASV